MPGNPVIGSTILRRPAIQSPNFITGISGWTVNADGSAEFNNLTIRGVFNGNDFILNANGFFLYSGTPAAGNLAYSLTNNLAITADSFGNAIPNTGATSYQATSPVFAQNVNGGITAWFSAATQAGPYTLFGSFGVGTTGQLIIQFNTVMLDNSATQPIPVPGISGSIATLPPDNNSGTGWVSGERAFMNNNWVNNINANFTAIISALVSAGIIT